MKNKALYLRTLPLHHSQTETKITENHSTFRFHLKPTFDFRQELLSLGNDVEVLQPEWLRQELKTNGNKYIRKILASLATEIQFIEQLDSSGFTSSISY